MYHTLMYWNKWNVYRQIKLYKKQSTDTVATLCSMLLQMLQYIVELTID